MITMEGWTTGQLGQLCSIEIGGTPSRSDPDFWDSSKETSNRWVSIRDLNRTVIIDTAEHISDSGVKHSNVKLQSPGTVLLSFKLSIGRVALAGVPLYTNEAIAGLNSEKIDLTYLFHGLHQWDLLQDVDQAIKGATLNKAKLKKIEFDYPSSKPEQAKIAEILSTVDRAIEQTEALIAKQQRIKIGLMQDLLSRGIDEHGNLRSEQTHQFKDSPLGRIPVEWEVSELEIVELEKYKTQYELALKKKIQVEIILEQLLEKPDQKLEEQLKKIQEVIDKINKFLKQNYDMEQKLNDAERCIRSYMEDLGNNFEFEESYRPIKLNFSLDTFDLWHDSGERKVFLRAMGSGANWLYCHLTLFLALHRYFCSLGDHCSIPSILFLDQPSQVYFPSVLDTAKEFSPEELAEKEGETRKRPVDDDIKAVTNLYSQLVKFCKETLRETGIEPQIIVTDHADNLTLDEGIPFETLVQGRRWRTRGFIEIPKSDE